MYNDRFKLYYLYLGFLREWNSFANYLTSTPTEELDFDAYMNGDEKCWVAYDIKKISLKKTIFLTGWSFELFDPSLKQSFHYLFSCLLEEGHPLYISTLDGLVEISDRSLVPTTFERFWPMRSDEAIELAAGKGIAFDSLDILNTKRLGELGRFLYQIEFTENLKLIPGNFPSFLPRLTPDYLKRFAEFFDPDEAFLLDPEEAVEGYKWGAINFQASKHPLDRQLLEYPDIQGINLVIDRNLPLTPLINAYPNLTQLTISRSSLKNATTFFPLDERVFLNLRELIIVNTKISLHLLYPMLIRATQLEVFEFSNSEILDGEALPFIFETNHFAKLKRLTIISDKLPTEYAMSLLMACPNLINLSINIDYSIFYHGLNQLPPMIFNQLIELNMNKVSLGVLALFQLLQSMPRLSIIKVNADIRTLSLAKNSKGLRYPQIKDCRFNALSLDDLASLLACTPELTSLDISDADNFDCDLSRLRELPPLKITSFTANNTRLSAEALQLLLDKMPQLVNLSLINCGELILGAIHLQLVQFPKLRTLDLSEHAVLIDSLQQWFLAAPKLEKLTLSKCLGLGKGILNLKPGSCPQLYYLKLADNPELDAVFIHNLVEAAPNLTYLDLSYSHLYHLNGSTPKEWYLPRLVIFRPPFALLEQQFSQLLQFSPVLSEAGYFSKLSEEFIPPKSVLALEKLNCYLHPDRIDTINQLFSRLPRLMEFLGTGQFPQQGSYCFPRSLVRLTLLESSVNPSQLEETLKQLPYLKNCTLINCENISRHYQDKCRESFPAIAFRFVEDKKMTARLDWTNRAIKVQNPRPQETLLSKVYHRVSHYLTPENSQAPSSSTTSGFSRSLSDYAPNFHRTDGKFQNDPKQTLEAQVLFRSKSGNPEVPVQHYHLYTYNYNSVEDEGEWELHQPNARDRQIINPLFQQPEKLIQAFNSNLSGNFIGAKTFKNLVPMRWYQLPGLSTQDKLLAFGVEPHQLMEFCRDGSTGYIYFRLTQPCSYSIKIMFTLQSNPLTPSERSRALCTLGAESQWIGKLRFDSHCKLMKKDVYYQLLRLPENQRIEALRVFCSFSKEYGADHRGKRFELFNYMIEHRVGVCRHRAQLFVALASELQLNAWLINNNTHSFVLVKSQQGLYTLDLGGGEAQILVHPFEELTFSPSTRKKAVVSSSSQLIQGLTLDASNRFQTWKRFILHSKDAQHLIEELSATNKPRHQLAVVNQGETIIALHEAFLSSKLSDDRFFSPNLDALSITSQQLSQGKIVTVDSPLAIFLHAAAQHANPVNWFINWSEARQEHLSYHSVIDSEERQIHGLAIPDNVRVIVLMDSVSAKTIGDEFSSRIHAISMLPDLKAEPLPPQPYDEIHEEDVLLTNERDWKRLLLGMVNFEGQDICIEPGVLLQAAHRGQPQSLSIHNAPWSNPEFCDLIREIRYHNRFYFNGAFHQLPEHFQLEFKQPRIDLSTLIVNDIEAASSTIHSDITFVLSHGSYASFFELFSVELAANRSSTMGLVKRPGLLEAHQNQTLTLHCTEALSEVEWYKLRVKARQYHIRLNIQSIPGLLLPPALLAYQKPPVLLKGSELVRVIYAEDTDAALTELSLLNNYEMIPVSDSTRFDNLFYHIHRKEDKTFFGVQTDLYKRIREGKPIILKGRFSSILMQRLQTLFIDPPSLFVNGEQLFLTGPLVILSEDNSCLDAYLYERFYYNPEKDLQRLDPRVAQSLLQVYQRTNVNICHSHFSDFPASGGLEEQMRWAEDLIDRLTLSAGQLQSSPLISSSSLHNTVEPKPTQPEDIISYLKHRRFVFLVSESGAGKSHMLYHRLPEKIPGLMIYSELEAMEAWLLSKELFPVLSIDEANLSLEHYLVFESLARGDSHCWWKGNLYQLGPNHRVIFAGNPEGYGGRFKASLFKRFPYYMHFIGESVATIIAPMIQKLDNPGLSGFVTGFYQRVQTSAMAITPRNAINLCQTTLVLKQMLARFQIPLSDELLIRYAALSELKKLNTQKKPAYELLCKELKDHPEWKEASTCIKTSLLKLLPDLNKGKFKWTASRMKIAISLLTMLWIREEKLKANPLFTQEQGINGLLLEGAPGLGKSRLSIEMLRAMGIDPVIIQLSKPQEARDKLVRAYQEGELVVIDEFNSLTDERLLNQLLSGLNASKPGFFILATQNRISYKHRNPLSKALTNRFCKIEVRKYSNDDLISIFIDSYELSHQEAISLLTEFKEAKVYGKSYRFFPLPGLRDMFTEAETMRQFKNIQP